MTQTFKIRLTDHGQMGCNVLVWANEKWNSVPRYMGGGLVAFDNRSQAIAAAKKWCAAHLRARPS